MDLTYNRLSPEITLSEIQQNFADVVTAMGALTARDFQRRAGIDRVQLEDRYQDNHYVLRCRAENLSAGWPGGNAVVDSVPFNTPANVIEAIIQYSVVCTDIGAPAGEFGLGKRSPLDAEITYLPGVNSYALGAGAANSADSFHVYATPNTFKDYPTANMKRTRFDSVGELVLVSTVADAAALNAAGSFITVTVMVRSFLRSA